MTTNPIPVDPVNQPIVINNNIDSGPIVLVNQEMMATITRLIAAADAMPVIADTVIQADELHQRMRVIENDIEKQRKVIKGPVDALAKEIQAAAKKAQSPLHDSRQSLAAKIGRYNRKVEEERRLAQEEAERKAREERERLEREAKEKAALEQAAADQEAQEMASFFGSDVEPKKVSPEPAPIITAEPRCPFDNRPVGTTVKSYTQTIAVVDDINNIPRIAILDDGSVIEIMKIDMSALKRALHAGVDMNGGAHLEQHQTTRAR